MKPERTVTRQQAREIDRLAIERYAIPGLILMENAGRACALAAARMLGGAEGKRVLVLAGKGNNGGDGYVVARHLTNGGASVEVLLLARTSEVLEAGGDAAVNLEIALRMGIPVLEVPLAEEFRASLAERADADLLVDALLGTGISGEVREPYLSAIRAANAAGRPVLAVDVPSGLDCDRGEPLGEAVRATRTVTFVAEKAGFRRAGADRYTGEVEVAEISVPRAAIEQLMGS